MGSRTRRPLATISVFGISQLHRKNPYIMLWWSAAFPGFGQYFHNQYLRATLLTLSEIATNTLAHVNEAIVYSFCGNIEMAKSIIQPRWVFGYLIIYLYTMWDSYRSTLVQNEMCLLAEMENERLPGILLHPLEIQYFEKKNPFTAAWYSLLFPGLGQLYNHMYALAFYAMIWWWIFLTLSHAHESIFYFLTGNIERSISVLNPHWLLFMPSVAGGAAYHAFITAAEHNRLYKLEQRQYLEENYGNSEVVSSINEVFENC